MRVKITVRSDMEYVVEYETDDTEAAADLAKMEARKYSVPLDQFVVIEELAEEHEPEEVPLYDRD